MGVQLGATEKQHENNAKSLALRQKVRHFAPRKSDDSPLYNRAITKKEHN